MYDPEKKDELFIFTAHLYFDEADHNVNLEDDEIADFDK